jgi:hypothetical protein
LGAVALFVALGETSYAALKLPVGSVGTKQIRAGAVTKAKLATDVTRRLAAPVLAGAQGPQGGTGPQGPQGAQGFQGNTGAQGAAGSALAYAHINPDGSVDTARSKNINRAVVFQTDTTDVPEYCINTTVTPHNVIAEASFPEHLSVGFGANECTHNGVTYNVAAIVDTNMGGGSLPYRTDFYMSIN